MSTSPLLVIDADLTLLLREPSEADDKYVLSSAVKTVRTANEFRHMDASEFHATVGRRLRFCWANDPIRLVACLPEDPKFIVAFVFGHSGGPGNPPILSYLHVRGSFCKMGIAGALAKRALGTTRLQPTAYQFPTRALDNMTSGGRWPNLIYHPAKQERV